MNKDNSRPNTGSKKPQTNSLEVKKQEELLKFLIANLPDKSRNKVKSILKNRQVFVNGKAITQFNHLLEPGQIVTLGKKYTAPRSETGFWDDNRSRRQGFDCGK